MSVEMDALQANVTATTTVVNSAITLINGIRDRIDAALALKDEEIRGQLTTLSGELGTDVTALADAVAANTVAATAKRK